METDFVGPATLLPSIQVSSIPWTMSTGTVHLIKPNVLNFPGDNLFVQCIHVIFEQLPPAALTISNVSDELSHFRAFGAFAESIYSTLWATVQSREFPWIFLWGLKNAPELHLVQLCSCALWHNAYYVIASRMGAKRLGPEEIDKVEDWSLSASGIASDVW